MLDDSSFTGMKTQTELEAFVFQLKESLKGLIASSSSYFNDASQLTHFQLVTEKTTFDRPELSPVKNRLAIDGSRGFTISAWVNDEKSFIIQKPLGEFSNAHSHGQCWGWRTDMFIFGEHDTLREDYQKCNDIIQPNCFSSFAAKDPAQKLSFLAVVVNATTIKFYQVEQLNVGFWLNVESVHFLYPQCC